MAVDVVLGTPLAGALSELVQAKIVEYDWIMEGNRQEMTDSIMVMLADGKSQEQVAELARDILGSPAGTEEFAQWLFEQAARLNDVTKDLTMTATQDKGVSFVFPPSLFNFEIGSKRKEFILHRNLLPQLSKPLHTLMNGIMLEAQQGVARLDDVDEETFARFQDFAYAFGSLSDTILQENSLDRELFPTAYATATCQYCQPYEEPRNVGLRICCGEEPDNHEHSVSAALCQILMRQPWGSGKLSSRVIHYADDREGDKQSKTLQRSLASSAKLYHFADRYLVTGLKDIAVLCLHTDINKIKDQKLQKHGNGSLADIMELFALTFDTLTDYAASGDMQSSEVNALKQMVAEFMLYKQYELCKFKNFRELMLRNGQIGLALLYATPRMLEAMV